MTPNTKQDKLKTQTGAGETGLYFCPRIWHARPRALIRVRVNRHVKKFMTFSGNTNKFRLRPFIYAAMTDIS
jgi:hypothetical protein